jgi:hypothetical protein
MLKRYVMIPAIICASLVYILYVGVITVLVKINVFGIEPFEWLIPMLYTAGIIPAIVTFVTILFRRK